MALRIRVVLRVKDASSDQNECAVSSDYTFKSLEFVVFKLKLIFSKPSGLVECDVNVGLKLVTHLISLYEYISWQQGGWVVSMFASQL